MMGKGKKILVAAAAIVAVGAMTVFGAGKVIGYSSSVNKNKVDYKNAREIRQAEDQLGAVPRAPQQFANGLIFDSGYFTMVDGMDENDNIVDSFPEIMITYGDAIFLHISPVGAYSSDEEIPAVHSRQSGSISINAYTMDYLFLPPDASPSAEDLALEEAGRLAISYGAVEEERETYRYVTWHEDGLKYLLSTFDVNYELEELLDMAEEVLAAE